MKVLCYGVRDVEKPIFDQVSEKFPYDVTCVPNYVKTVEDVELAKGYDAVILRGNCFAKKEFLDLYKSYGVKYLLTRTAGTDHIDIPYAKELGFKMAFVPGYSPNAIAELAVGLALSLARNISYTTNRTSNKNFTVDADMFAKEIRNSTVGVIGIGRIGITAAQLFKGLGANVIAYDAFKKEDVDHICTQVSLDELIEQSDIITIHAPFIKENGKVITKEFLAKMKKGAILVNAARGELQDLDAIIESLESGHLRGLGLDVIEGESAFFFKNLEGQTISDPRVEKLVNMYPRVLITPHMGSYTDEAVLNMVETSFDNLKEFIDTDSCKNSI